MPTFKYYSFQLFAMRLGNESRFPQGYPPGLYYDSSLRSLTLVDREGERYLLNNNPRHINIYRPSSKLISLKDHPSILRNTGLLMVARKVVEEEHELGDLLSQALSEIQIH